MSKFFKSLLLLLSAGVFAATGWAAEPDVTGVIPWARYEFNGSDANTGDGGKTWNSGGGFSYTVTGARGDAATNVSATGSRWTSTGNSEVLSSGLTVSVLATEGTTLAGGTDDNGHIFSMAQKNQVGYPRWWIRNSSSGTVKLQGLFTTALDVTNSVEPTGFHHYVVRISADRTKVDVFVDGIKIDSSALTVATNLDDTIYGYQLNGRWGGGTGPNATLDDVRIYDEALTDAQIAKLNVTLSKYAAIGKCRDLGIAIPENTNIRVKVTPQEVTNNEITVEVTTENETDANSIAWTLCADEHEYEATKDFENGAYALTATLRDGFESSEFSTEEAPILAKAVTVAETTSFGATSDQDIDRTIDGKNVIVAKVTEMTAGEYAASIFGVHSQAQGDKTAVQRDVYLNVTGGKYNYIVGGSENHWQGSHATPLQGNIFLEMGSGVTANNVIGVAHKGGDGTDAKGEFQTLTGNATTIVHGSVRGWIVGGVTTAHNCVPLITGDTLVRVTSVQTNNEGGMNDNGLAANDTDRILGGSAKIASNGNNGAKQTGNASVEIILPNGSEGSFVKEIAGGSYASGSKSYAITGNTSVSIDAPQTVTFTKPIYGGSITDGAQAPISGTASVTINGGTFTSTINAGAYGDNAKAAGVSTLTINGGDLSAATVQPGAVTSSKLVINKDVTIGTLQAFDEYEVADDAVLTVNTADLSGLTAPMTLASGTGTLTIGQNRNVTYAGFGSGVVAVTVTAGEIVDAKLQLPVTTAVTTAPEVARFALTSETGDTITPTEITLAEGMLTITLPSMYVTVTESKSWSVAVGESSGAVLVVGGATAEDAVEVTIDAEVSNAITEISITDYVKMATEEGVSFPANKVKFADGAHLELTAPSQTGDWSISKGATLTLIGGEDESATTTLSNKVTVANGGTLETKGYLTLSGENKVIAGGSLKVLTGYTVLYSGENGNGLCGRIEIAYGATLKSTRTDGLHYNGSPEVHVYGTLDMDTYRWTVGTNNKFYIYGGATITGAGDGHGALDFLTGTHTVTIPSTNNQGTEIEIPAALRLRDSNTLVKIDAQLANSKIKLTGTVKDPGALQKVGTGNSHLELSGETKTYTGATTVSNGYLDLVGGTTLATSSIVVNGGTALQFLADENNTAITYSIPITNNGRIDKFGEHTVTLEGVISGAGTLNAKAGTWVLTAANTRGAGAVTIDAGAVLDVASENARLYNNSDHFNATMTVRGTLRVREWDYGQCLGNLAHNYGRLQLDGGRIVVTTDVESARSFTVTSKGGTIEVASGKTYTYNGSGSDEAWLVFNEGAVLTIDGSGTFVANGVSGSAANIGAISVAQNATFKRGTNAGSVASLTLADGATLNVENGAITVNGTVNLSDALKIVLPNDTLPTAEAPVTLLNTTAFEGDEGYAYVALTVNGAETEDYILRKTATALTLVPAPDWEDVTSVTATSDVTSWAALLAKMEANSERFEEGVTPTLIIDFGSEGGEAGTFTFNNKAAITFTSITVQGTNGGTIVMADGAEIDYGTLVLNTTVAADAAFYAANTGAIEGTGKLCLASGELTLDEANTYAGGTDIVAGAKLTITNAGAISTGVITGAGTLVCDGFMPTNKAGLTDATNWTGTLTLSGINPSSKTGYTLCDLGNASSVLELANFAESGDDVYLNEGTTMPFTLKVTGSNYFTNGNSNRVIEIAKIAGSGTLVLKGSPTETWKFGSVASDFSGGITVEGGRSVVLGAGNSAGSGKITIASAINIASATLTAVNGVEVASAGTLSGSGTIDSALTLANGATIDTTAGAVKVTGAVTLSSALTVKIAAAPAIGAAVPLLNAANVTIPDGMAITVMAGEEEAEGSYQLIKTPTALLLENAPAEDVTIVASNIAAAASYTTGDMGNYDSHGVQVDLDGPTPYAPGWVSGVCYPLVSVGVVSDADGSVAAGTCVQVVATDDPTVVVATSAPFQNENKEDVTVTSSNGTNTYKLYTFKFETPVYVDAAKTYQFRFVNGEGAAVTCKLRALYTSDANGGGDNQRYCNWLNAQYEVIDVANVPPRYAPYVVLTAERTVDNSPILSGDDETLEVDTVPEKIRLDTKTFGYGTHTVLQYTGGTTNWEGMDVEGLPEGAEVIKTDTTWGFAIKTLNVLTVGDSITAGLVTYHNSNANWHVPGGYRLPLYKRLTRAGYTVKYLGSSDVFGTSSVGGGNANEANPSPSLGDNDHHEGHSGITLVTMLERFNNTNVQNEIALQGTPDVITLHLGTNDIADVTGDEAISNDAEKVLSRMKNLLNRLQELYPNTKILVAKIIARSGNKNEVVKKFNDKLEDFFESNQEENLILVDLGINDVTYGLLRYDGLHPSTEGYTQMAKGWFDAIDAAFDPFGEATDAPTPVTSTPTADVNESDRTVDTVGMAGVLKAAEWTTFTGFATGFTSQFGYMPDSERPWQLDVRGENVPTVADGVLSLNGAPITVNPVDGRLGTTKSTYTIVMKVSNLAANDVIFTDSSVRNDDWPENVNTNYKGTTNADLLKMTVGNATTLKVQYKENSEQTVSLTDVDLTDATPEVIAVVVKQNAFSIFVNGTKVATDVSLGGAINESYRGSFSIGALSADNAGSAMKLYRLSFYEGEVTAIAAPIATTATINVGEGAGQYITWETAKTGLNLADEMESLTINFTAADQTFTFDNTDVVTIDSVTVQGTAGGTLANAGTATVTATNLAINTNVTMNKCYIVDKNTLPIETTNNIAIAKDCVLTYYITGGQSTVTVAATHSGEGKIAKTSWGTLEITNTCAVNVDVNQGQFKVNVPINGEKKSIENQKTVKLTGSTLILTSGLSYATFDGDETSIIRVDGDYTFGISNSFTNDLDAGEIQIDAGKTLTIRNFKSGYVLSPSKLLRVNGTLQRDANHGQNFKVSIPATSTLEGSGSITQAIELADGATVHCSATPLAVNTVAFAEGTLNVTGADALANGETVTLFRTTAYAAATGLVEGVVARRVATADETNYRLCKTADAIEVWPSATDAETWTVDAATATTWADVVNQMAAANKRPADTTALTIDFGDKPQDGDAVPGTFSFGEGDVTLGSLTVTGSNGGTITTTGTVMVSTSAAINTAVAVTGQIQLNGLTIDEGAELAITNYAVVGDKVSGAGILKITGATLNRGLDTDIVSNTWTGTVILEDVDDNLLDLRYLVNDSITSTEGTLTITASSSLTIEGTVKAYIYDGAIKTLTLNGDFQMANGTTNKSYTQCVTVDNLAGAGAFIGHQSSEVCIAVNVKSWSNFTGSIDLSNEKSKNTIFFFGTAPERFATSITPGNVGADDSDFTDADYGTIYVTEGDLVTAVGSTWKAPKVNIANGTSLTIQGWFGASESITGLSANTIVGGVKNSEDEVVEAGVLDLRALDDLTGVNVTVKAGGRLLVNTGATVPNTIVFEAGSILGVATKHVEDVGNATLTVNVNGTAATVPTIKGYHMDGVTELDNWAKNNETSSEGEFKFNFDPVFDGELCWWAYEFDNEVNTSAESNLGPISTGRDKGRMNFDGRGDSNRVCQDNEYVDHGDGTKAIRVASSPWRNVDGGYPTAFTAAMFGTLTENRNRIIMGFGSSYNQKYTIALVTGASTDEVRLVLQKGWNENNTDYPEDAVITLATTTVPNAVTENHLFAFSYEQFDSDADKAVDSTRIIFYVDGEKYQPFTAKAIIPLGNGFQMGSIHGGWHNSLTRMNGDDVDCTMEYLRIYDQILPESVWTAMSNEYSYMSKNGRATRTIVAGQDTTWNENTEWTQIRAVKDDNGDYVLDAEGHVTFDNGTDVEKPDHGENVGTQVVLNVSGENALYLNEFYSNPIQTQNGEVSKLYYERLEINPVEGGDEDSLTLWAGRNNPNVADENKNSQSAVITVQGYTKINTNVTMAHNVAFLSGPVAVAEGKWLHFDFSGFDVMKVPSMPVTYRLTGFLDEDTRTRVTSTAPADPVNARSIDLGYKTTVNQYTFTVDRYPVTAYFTADDDPMVVAHNNDTTINFNSLYYIWQGNNEGKQMNWEAEAVDPQGNPIVENTLAKFVSLDAETKQEKMVTVTLATNDVDPITLTLNEGALTKETTPAGTDGEGNPTEAVVENMLGEQQLIVGKNVIVNYTGEAATLARTLNEASAETTGVIRTAGFTVDAWRANLSVTGGALAGVGKISGKVTFEEGATLDASAATAEACLSAKDADLTNLKAITVDYEAAAGKTLKVLSLPAGHTAKSLIGCTVTAVDGAGNTVATWRETDNDPTKVALVVVRADGLYVTGRPAVKAGETEVKNNDLTLPLARRAAELSATSVSLTGVVNMKGDPVDAPVADAAEVFTNVAFDMSETVVDGVATAKLKYDFGVTKIGVVTIEESNGEGETVEKQYVVAELIVSNNADLDQNSAAYADGTTIDVTVKVGATAQVVTVEAAADMTGATVAPATVLPASTRYVRFPMPSGNGTFEIKARASK